MPLRQTLPAVPRDPIDRAVLAFMCAAQPELERDVDVPVDMLDAAALCSASVIRRARYPHAAREFFCEQLQRYLGREA